MSVHPDHRFPWGRTAILAAVVAVGFAAAGWLLTDAVTPTGSISPAPTQAAATAAPATVPSSLLLAMRDGQGRIGAATLVATDPVSGTGALLHVPPSLLVPVSPVSRVADLGGPLDLAGLASGVSAVLGVRIDATVVLDPLAWRGLLDETGSPMTWRAVDLGDVLARLPEGQSDVAQVVSSLGSMAQSNAPNEVLVRVIGSAGQVARSGGMRVAAVPVLAIRGGRDGASVLEQPAASQLVRATVPGALLGGAAAAPGA